MNRSGFSPKLRYLEHSGDLIRMIFGVALTTFLSVMLEPFIGYRAVGFIFLSSVLGMSFLVPILPAIGSAILSSLIWDYYFIPPKFTFHIEEKEDLFMLAAYFLSAIATGILTTQIARQKRLIADRELRTQILYKTAKAIGEEREQNKLVTIIENLISDGFGFKCKFHFAQYLGLKNNTLSFEAGKLSNRELESAEWSFKTGALVRDDRGRLTLPLKGHQSFIGIMLIEIKTLVLIKEDESLLLTISEQTAVAIERLNLEEKAKEASRLQESERLHQTLLNSISHEFRTPLTAILTATAALQQRGHGSDQVSTQLYQAITSAGGRLNRLVENLLDMSRLESGILILKKELHDVNDLIGVAAKGTSGTLCTNPIITKVAPNLPLIVIDFGLIVHVLANLILNASLYSPVGSEISVSAETNNDALIITVSDQGIGVPPEHLNRIFEKFYRVPGSRAGGTGLGLTIAQNIIELHGGKLIAKNKTPSGLCVSFSLPCNLGLEKMSGPL
ncbi:MAG: DUF4118 domain-containing protein [Moraxellaceae bacterium]|nr:DUF4118 domain-containing protein [Pseudobdellovibrionaceae bacterium]